MSGLGLEVRAFAVAAAFLSRLPLARRFELGGADLTRASWAFPAIGAGLGCLVGASVLGAAQLMPPLAAGTVGVATGLLATGGLHLDGLADSADGLGGTTRERSLAIMRDHPVGAYGAAAIGIDLILKSSLLAALLERPELLGAVAVAMAVSRAAILPPALLLPYARSEPGLGAALAARQWGARCLLGVALAAALAFAVLGESGVAVLAAAMAVTAAIGSLSLRRLGGITGDVLGATVELAELAALTAIVAST